ncbi:MAG: cell division protein ZapA [Lachnospiraceae bacterium]|nr:cell division protein ZapA [Lachnospiraceae bacterium]
MAEKKDIPVVLNDRIYTLSGYENDDYIQSVVNYINNKLAECKSSEQFRRMNKEHQNMLVALNIADDFFRIKNQADNLTEEDTEKEKQLYDLRHEMIEAQIKHESDMRLVEEYKEQVNALQRKLIQLEAEKSRSEQAD